MRLTKKANLKASAKQGVKMKRTKTPLSTLLFSGSLKIASQCFQKEIEKPCCEVNKLHLFLQPVPLETCATQIIENEEHFPIQHYRSCSQNAMVLSWYINRLKGSC